MENQKQFLETLNFYRGKAALQISPSPQVGLIFLNLAQSIPGMESKIPAKAQKKYQWDKKLTVSFNFDGALEVAATAHALMEGREELVTDSQGNLPSWYRDPKKAGRQGNAKTLGFYRAKNQPKGAKATYYLGIIENTKDKQRNKVGIPLEHSDLFKIASVMQEAALALLGWRKDIEQLKETNGHLEAEKEPLQRSPEKSRHPDFRYDPAARAPQKTLTTGAAPLAPHLLYQAKADNSAVFVGLVFFLLSGGEGYRITHNYEIADWDRLTDSLSR